MRGEDEICKNCAFLYEQPNANTYDSSTCRFHPPVVVVKTVKRIDDEEIIQDVVGAWPGVRDDDWCGYFKKDGS